MSYNNIVFKFVLFKLNTDLVNITDFNGYLSYLNANHLQEVLFPEITIPILFNSLALYYAVQTSDRKRIIKGDKKLG